MFYPCYACGKSPEELDWWLAGAIARSAVPMTCSVIVLGDDSFWVINDGKRIYFGENDFSMYDRTQHPHAMAASWELYSYFGIPSHVIDRIRDIYYMYPIVRFHKAQVHATIKCPPQRDTGGADTSLGNSINNIVASAWVVANLLNVGDVDEWKSRYLLMGFSAKMRLFDTVFEPTFLKGKWWLAADGYRLHWAQLPSQILKFGKVMNSPAFIGKTKDRYVQYQRVAFVISKGLHMIPNVPILHDFLEVYSAMAGDTWEDAEVATARWLRHERSPYYPLRKIPVVLDSAQALLDIQSRYNLDLQDIVGMQRVLRSIKSLPAYVSHPSFITLMMTDYA